MPETPSEKEETSETVNEVYRRVQDLSEEELRELYSRLSSGTEDGDADYRSRIPYSEPRLQQGQCGQRDLGDNRRDPQNETGTIYSHLIGHQTG